MFEILLLSTLVIIASTIFNTKKAHAALIKNLSPEEAYEELISGNKRYLAGNSEKFNDHEAWRKHTAIHGQYPIATVLACSDARMPVETLLDQGSGDVFVIRVAGNIAGDQVLGSIDYSLNHLEIPLILVLGHTQCGAIYSAVDNVYDDHVFTTNEEKLLTPLMPLALRSCLTKPNPSPKELKQLKEDIIVENVWKEMSQIMRSSKVTRHRMRNNLLKLVGAVYNIKSGKVNWLGEHKDQQELIREDHN